jgi:hypothetical protein
MQLQSYNVLEMHLSRRVKHYNFFTQRADLPPAASLPSFGLIATCQMAEVGTACDKEPVLYPLDAAFAGMTWLLPRSFTLTLGHLIYPAGVLYCADHRRRLPLP